MAELLSPMTELEGVNILLGAIGMAPTTSVDVADVDVQQALEKLRTVSRQVQAVGWYFNTEYEYPLSKNGSNEIPLATNIAKVTLDPYVGMNWDLKVVVRGAKLYNMKKHSFTFDNDLKATVTVLLNFDELPQEARDYIAVRAARIYQDGVEGLADSHTFSAQDEFVALSALLNMEAETGQYNMKNNHEVAWMLCR